MKFLRRQFLQLAFGAALAPVRSAARHGANRLSDASHPPSGRLCRGRRQRHSGAADRQSAVGAARPARRHRKPPWRRRQSGRRPGRACGARWLHAAPCRHGECDQRVALSRPRFQFCPRHGAGGDLRPQPDGHGGEPVISGENRSSVHRLCQSASGDDRNGLGRHRRLNPCRRRIVSDADRNQIHRTCRITARRRHSTICWPGGCR